MGPSCARMQKAQAQCHLVLASLRIRQKLWGGQSCPQPPFRRLFRAMSDFVARQGRLKAGCSQDWLPHNLCRIAMASKTKWHWAKACPTKESRLFQCPYLLPDVGAGAGLLSDLVSGFP